MLILGTREILVGKNSKIKRGLFSRCGARNSGTSSRYCWWVLWAQVFHASAGQYIFKGPVHQSGGPAHVELQKIPLVSPVHLNDGGELQPRAITSCLQPSKPSQSAPMHPFPSHTENTAVAMIPWSSKECCLNFLTSVMPSWARMCPSS